MYSQVVEALLAMGEYAGTGEALLTESARVIQDGLKCSAEHADEVLRHLMAHNIVAFEFTQERELSLSTLAIPATHWYWYVPSAA